MKTKQKQVPMVGYFLTINLILYFKVWPAQWGSKGSVSYLHSVSWVCLSADWAVPASMSESADSITDLHYLLSMCLIVFHLIMALSLGFWVQRVVPAADPWACALLSVWKLPREQSEAERGVAVSVNISTCILSTVFVPFWDTLNRLFEKNKPLFLPRQIYQS